MNAAMTWNAHPHRLGGFLGNTMTSDYTGHPSLYNGLASVILLMASRITNAASLFDTAETLQLKENGARQLTTSNAWLIHLSGESATVAAPLDAARESSHAEAISELRRMTGFTWDQIARLFSVSRRSAHLWASGAPMSSENEEHLYRILGIVQRSNRGHIQENRAALLSPRGPSGHCAFDLLVAGAYEHAMNSLGAPTETSLVMAPRDAQAPSMLTDRVPLAPDVLVSALQDDRPMAPRQARAAQYRKVPRAP